jgi:hypothetical protein
MNIVTTLNQLYIHGPCKPRWNTLLAHLHKRAPDDEPLPLSVILDSNGLYDTIWCMRAVPNVERELRLYAARCLRLLDLADADANVLHAIDMVERFADGKVTDCEMAQAGRDALATRGEGPLSVVQAATLQPARVAAYWTVTEIARWRSTGNGGDIGLEPGAPYSSDLSQLFREMFCTDEPTSIQETIE